MKKIIVLSIICMFLVTSISFAETKKSVDLERLSDQARNEILNLEKKDSANVLSTKKVLEFKDEAIAIAETFGTVLRTLNVEVNEFAKTPVGQFTIFVIGYKVFGKDILTAIVHVNIWLLITLIIGISFWILHIPKKFKVKDEKGKVIDIKYIPRNQFVTKEGKGISMFLHGSVWIIFTIVMIAKAF